jgi:4-amino-4-deoxy-L-arabinose transferase-like glycosyltransferase
MSISALRHPADVDSDEGRGSTLRRRAVTLVTGRPDDPRWVRPVLFVVLLAAALLSFWHLSRNGWSNEYYAAAARSGSLSWKAWFFGSIDPGSFITVDKPPLSLWAMGLSIRVFGWSSFAMLLPQALFTVGSVAVLNATVRRVFGPVAGLIAGAALATTPVIVAVGRVNNPDAMLIFLLIASAWLAVRAIETGKTKFLVSCGAVVGLAFMTKMLEGWMVVPALAAAYLFAGPPQLLTRIRQLALAGVSMVVVSAAWPVAVTLWPGSKPYIGGSTNGSIWNLILGYNGFGRLTGSEGGMGGGGGGASFGGAAGLWRMFNEQVGGQVAWLLPLAGVSIVAGLWLTRRNPRVDLQRAGFVLFGLWAIVLVAVFSSQKGIFHPYYVSALAPAVAALTGGGLVVLVGWARRSWLGLGILDATVAGTAWLSVDLLNRTPDFAPALRTVVPVAAAVAILASVALRLPAARSRVVLGVATVAAIVALGAGPAAYAITTTSRSLDGNNVLAGPASIAQGGFGGGGARGGFGGGTPPSGATGGPPSQTQSGSGSSSSSSSVGSLFEAGGTQAGGTQARGGGGMGGGDTVSSALIAYLEAHQGSAKYLVAASGSQSTAPIIIATGKAVVTIGGFGGSDPAPTLAQLQQMVASGQLKYVLIGGGGMGGRGSSSAITQWVQKHGTAVTSVTTSSGTLYRVTA